MIRLRERVEAIERETLAPYATWSGDEAAARREHEEPADRYRTAFQRDRDRILHSAAFRALQHKTQVFVVHEADFYRTRLTHTLEVAQVARSLASYLGANQVLAEAIALAHDLGHAPFGHAGEEELTEARIEAGVGPFDHNLQSLRIVTVLERRDPRFGGLNLSFAAREGLARHETAFDRPPEVAGYRATREPGIEAQIANVADRLAYLTHDLEDALRLRFFEEAELRALELPILDGAPSPEPSPRGERELASERPHAIHRGLLHALIEDLLAETERRLDGLRRGAGEPAAADVRAAAGPVVAFSGPVAEQAARLQTFLYRRVYKHPTVLNMCTKGQRILRALFDHFLAKPDHLPRSVQARLGPASKADLAEAVCDYLAAMTDRYAMDLYKMLFEPYERTLVALE